MIKSEVGTFYIMKHVFNLIPQTVPIFHWSDKLIFPWAATKTQRPEKTSFRGNSTIKVLTSENTFDL